MRDFDFEEVRVVKEIDRKGGLVVQIVEHLNSTLYELRLFHRNEFLMFSTSKDLDELESLYEKLNGMIVFDGMRYTKSP